MSSATAFLVGGVLAAVTSRADYEKSRRLDYLERRVAALESEKQAKP